MDAQEARVLSFAGFLIYFNVFATLFTVMGYALYFPIFVSSIRILCRRIKKSIASRFLFALTIVLFISTTIHFVSSLAITLKLVQWTNIASRTTPVKVRMDLTTAATALSSSVAFYSGRINISLVDAIVIWRAYVLWSHSRLLRVAFVVSFIATVLYSLVMMVFTPSPESFGLSQVVIDALNVVRDALALAVNIFATVCIGIQGWRLEKTSSAAIYPSLLTVLVSETQESDMKGSTFNASSKPSLPVFAMPSGTTNSFGTMQQSVAPTFITLPTDRQRDPEKNSIGSRF
ncbi:hypothetical protein DL96DRAFT_1639379 [Flagelloscypha sp. PMI_526]|nr:hypothetical protein DL96DRAFT_1639379 [Flagelloscypha sp. PMI_526]